jgi:BirA family biotin operon repressor/biotin-[acetyl-CoA-carboxylase] ligase
VGGDVSVLEGERIVAALDGRVRVFFYEVTDSTNTRAKEYARGATLKEPCAFIAREQTAGRGRLGRSFLSRCGGIYLSLLIPAKEDVTPADITAEAAVKAARAIRDTVGLEVGIKWVNDLYVGGKKLAGILTEGVFGDDGKLAYYIIGMGINVYKIGDFNEILPIATSIEDVLGERVNINELAATLTLALASDIDPEECLMEYRARSVVTGRHLTVVGAEECYSARAIEILDDYSLLVERESDGERVRVFTGEVSVRL